VDHLVMAKTCRALADRAISVAQTWDEQDESDDNAPPCPRCASAIPRDILVRVRDMTFGEDASRIRTGAGPQVMSSIRNLATSLHRLSRATNVAAALRHHGRNALRPLQLLKID
jgi:hypothetical protein